MNRDLIALILGIMCFILTLTIAVQYRTVEDASKVAGTEINSELKTEVLRWKQRYEETYSVLEEAESILEELQKEKGISKELAEKLKSEL